MKMKDLTPRQAQVAREIATGASNKEIAHRLGLSVGTVKIYVSHIFTRTGADNRVQVALWVRGIEPAPEAAK